VKVFEAPHKADDQFTEFMEKTSDRGRMDA
jgi:hypothetical protein